jgi:hypothetical protein
MNKYLLSLAAIMLLALAGCGGNDASPSALSTAQQAKHLTRSEKAQASDYQTEVQQLYVAYFGRPADPGGLVNFENALLAAGAPTNIQDLVNAYATNPAIAALINSFGTSKESQNLYGSGTTTAFVTTVFQNVLGRPPLTAGLNYWVAAISTGGLNQGNAALSIMAGALANNTPQGQLDATLINNRLAIASYFTAQVTSQNALSAYAGPTAANIARTMLSTVTATTDINTYDAVAASTVPYLGTPSATLTLTAAAGATAPATALGPLNAHMVGASCTVATCPPTPAGTGCEIAGAVPPIIPNSFIIGFTPFYAAYQDASGRNFDIAIISQTGGTTPVPTGVANLGTWNLNVMFSDPNSTVGYDLWTGSSSANRSNGTGSVTATAVSASAITLNFANFQVSDLNNDAVLINGTVQVTCDPNLSTTL